MAGYPALRGNGKGQSISSTMKALLGRPAMCQTSPKALYMQNLLQFSQHPADIITTSFYKLPEENIKV
jgi:hypothetical protein